MKLKSIIILFAICCGCGRLLAQSSEQLLNNLMQEDRASIEAIALYPEATRSDILRASQYPELIVRISEMQQVTSQQFQNLMEPYSQEEQARFWELARYPALVSLMAGRNGLKESHLRDFPENVHDDARWADEEHHDVIVKMDQGYKASESAFASLLNGYPIETQQAFRDLVDLPEVMGILSENLKMTVLMGDLYRRDPVWVTNQLDSLSMEVARRNAADLEAWRDSLEQNPQAVEELQASAEEFRKAQGEPAASQQEVVHYTTTVVHYDPYPWWYGYPTWYTYPYWYPYPYWYHSGFYYGPGGGLVVNWMPSPYFTNWYFYQPYHHYYYPYLTDCFVSYHQGHRDSPSGFNQVTGGWVQQNRDVFGKNWLKDDGQRVTRIQEYGKFETNYHNAVTAQPSKKSLTAQQYFDAHVKEYPHLKQSLASSPGPKTISRPATQPWPTTKSATASRPQTQPKGTYNPKGPERTKQPVGESGPYVRPKQQMQPQPEPRQQVRPREQVSPREQVRPREVRPYEQMQPREQIRPKENYNPKPNYEPKRPTIERPQQDIRGNNPAPSYHRDSWQRVSPQPQYSPKPSFSPKGPSYSPKQNMAPRR